jgi:hypothetical protein
MIKRDEEITSKEYVTMILRDDFRYTFKKISKEMNISERYAFFLYHSGIEKEKEFKLF